MHNPKVVVRLPGQRGRGKLWAFTGLLALGLVGGCGDDAAGASDGATTTGESTSEATATTGEATVGTTDGTTTDPGGSMSMSEGTTTDASGTTTEDPGTTTVGETESTGPGTTTESESTTTGVVTTGDVTTGDELCASDVDCQDPNLPVCHSQSGECVACTPDNDPCDLGSYCGDANTCVSGCLGPDNCPEDSFCDPENNACVATAASCLELLGWGYEQDGDYPIDPDGEGEIPAFSTYCDMTTDGGGWTELTLMIACEALGGELTAVQPAPMEGIDEACRPFTRDAAGHHTYHYTIPFPPGFGELYLHDYIAKANGSNASNTSDIYPGNFVQSLWSVANHPSTGDISFGSADEDGPTTSFAAEMVGNFDCWNCELEWPAEATIYSVQADSKALRIGWGERGSQHEGWFPWWSGTIRIR